MAISIGVKLCWGSAAFTSAPAASNTWPVSILPSRAAYWSGVIPPSARSMSAPDQGCRPVDIRGVGIHMLLQQSPDHGDVTVFDGIDEARIVERAGGYEARCQ